MGVLVSIVIGLMIWAGTFCWWKVTVTTSLCSAMLIRLFAAHFLSFGGAQLGKKLLTGFRRLGLLGIGLASPMRRS